jgi:hypothetical protein
MRCIINFNLTILCSFSSRDEQFCLCTFATDSSKITIGILPERLIVADTILISDIYISFAGKMNLKDFHKIYSRTNKTAL